MRRTSALPELLAPAGSFECLISAVAAGADAVYIGGKRFGARAYAENFDTGAISRAVSYCHLHGVRLYVTVNTLVLDKEMEELISYVRELYLLGVDAVIISDLGAIREIRRAVPGLELHASTQMSVHNSLGAEEAYKLGCSRVVLAREVSYRDMCEITDKVSPEIEVFLHGALCVCHSGQCLFSSMVGGRSGNRGECAQPCRLPFSTTRGRGYPLSLKDLSLAEHIPELIESGVASLKIEGRMKSAGYVYTVTSIYRRLLDERRRANDKEMDTLRRAFSRGGFTDGYYTARLDSEMTGVRSDEDKRDSREVSDEKTPILRHSVRARAKIVSGEPAELTLYDENRVVTAIGEIPAVAERSPLSEDGVKERLCKMGNTFLSLSLDDIELTLDDGLNLSPAAINGLRREAAEKFENFGRDESFPEYSYKIGRARGGIRTVSAEFYSDKLYLELAGSAPSLLSWIEHAYLPLFASDEAIKRSGSVSLPPVISESELSRVRERLSRVIELGVDRVMVSNIGHLALIRELGVNAYGGFRLNITNRAAMEVYKSYSLEDVTLSPELTLPMARDIGGAVITYGRIPLMLTERCFVKENFGCDACGRAYLTDRRGERFPMLREFDHRTLILNSAVTYMGDRPDELSRCGIGHIHLLFTTESCADAKSAIISSRSGEPLAHSQVRRIGKRQGERKRK